MFVTPFGIVTVVSLEQPFNAHAPMLVTPAGIVTEARPAGTATNVFSSRVISKPFFVA